ncbi:MAG: glycosyltransferase family 4 protein [Rhodospirillaceae bacterium]|jgi:colanic acid biosynthesis glycosyl transferase WcaI|nr:glycosyltransferase family 4 protein [Rhodospirillaceae bacterium]
MKILFLTENFPPETNAAATRVYERALYWVKAGHQVTVITCAPNFPQGALFDGYKNRWRQTEDMSGINVVRVKTYISANRGVIRRSLDFLSFGVMGFMTGLFQPRPDIVAATSPQFFAAVAGWAIGACRRLPFVFELGDLWPTSIAAVGAMKKGFLLNLVEKFELFLYRRSARIAALTQAFKKNLISRGIDETKIDVVLNGVDLPRYAPRIRDSELAAEWQVADKFVIGYVGTHGMAHGLANVLEAAERLRDLDDIRFLLAGAGAERDMLMETAKQKSLPNVIFLPMQPKEKMPAVWSLCDIALVHLKNSPAFAEVIPSKMFEAMAMGLPILLSVPEGEARRILDGHQAGLWVPPENPEALAEAAKKLLKDKSLREHLAQKSLAAAPEHSRSAQAEEMIAVFEKALMGKRQP